MTISTNQYKAGMTDYLQVITAQVTALTNQVNKVSLQTRRISASILLIESLGGGWDVSKLPGNIQMEDMPQAEDQIAKGKK